MAERTNILLIAALAVVTTGCSDVRTPGIGSWEFEDDESTPTVTPADDRTEGSRWVETEIDDRVCGSEDLGVEVVSVGGTVTGDRWPMSRDALWWSVVYKDARTDARYVFEVEVDGSGAESYVGELPAGRYDIELQAGNLPHCTYMCSAARRTVDVGLERTFDFEVDFTQVDGEFWLDEGQNGFPTEPSAHLEFRSVETGTVYSADVSRGSAGGYQVVVPVGEYDVTWVPDGPAEIAEFAPVGVGNVGRFDLGSGEYLRLELNSMTVQGEVLVDGAIMPDDTLLDGEPRGMLRFSLMGPPYGNWEVPLGEVGPGAFSQRVFPGDYTIQLITNGDTEQGVLVPNRSISVCGGEACRIATETGPLIVDVEAWLTQPLVWVNGQLDMEGTFGANCDAGSVYFKLASTEAPRMQGVTVVESLNSSYYLAGWSADVDAQGRFEVELPQGSYEVSLRRGQWDCADASLGATLLDADAEIVGSRSNLYYVVETGGIAGELTVNGGTMPDNRLSGDLRGVLELRHAGGTVSIPLGTSGPALLEQPLLAGTYKAVIVTEIFGRVLVPYNQDVLPAGERELGMVTVHPGDATVLDLDLDIVALRDTVQFSGLRDLAGTLEGRELAVQLVEVATGVGYEFPMDSSGEFAGPAYPGTYEALLVQRTDVWPNVSGPPLGESLISTCYVVER